MAGTCIIAATYRYCAIAPSYFEPIMYYATTGRCGFICVCHFLYCILILIYKVFNNSRYKLYGIVP